MFSIDYVPSSADNMQRCFIAIAFMIWYNGIGHNNTNEREVNMKRMRSFLKKTMLLSAVLFLLY